MVAPAFRVKVKVLSTTEMALSMIGITAIQTLESNRSTERGLAHSACGETVLASFAKPFVLGALVLKKELVFKCPV